MLQEGEGRKQAQQVAGLLEIFLGPLEQWLDEQIDRRLVRTFFLALAAMVRLRHNRSGLLLSELGAHIISPDFDCGEACASGHQAAEQFVALSPVVP